MTFWERLKKLLETNPYDWIAHALLAAFIFWLNYATFRAVCFSLDNAILIGFTGSINFMIAIELTQLSIFGIRKRNNQCTPFDYFADLLANAVGIALAYIILRIW